jgi:hypothetical protein
VEIITLAIIGFVAIAGPTVLALVLYWRDSPDRRLSWRRAAETSGDTDPAHFRRPGSQAWLFFMGLGPGIDAAIAAGLSCAQPAAGPPACARWRPRSRRATAAGTCPG